MNNFDIPDEELFEPEQKDGSSVAIQENLGKVNSSLSEFDRIVAGLNELHQRFPVDAIYEVTTTKGMEAAKAHRAAWRDPRINVEKIRKMAKSPVLALGKDIDARAAWITEQLLIGEEPIDQLIKAEESRKDQERADREAKEAGRILAIQEALGELAMQGMTNGLRSAEISLRLESLKSTELEQPTYQEMLPQAQAAKDAAIAKLEVALKAAQWDEEQAAKAAEAARIAEQARVAELAKIEAERAENKRKAEELAQREAKIAEAEAKARAEEAARFEAEQRRKDEEAAAQRAATLKAAENLASKLPEAIRAGAIDPEQAERIGGIVASLAADAVIERAAKEEPPTLKLGQINERLGYTVTADLLARLGFVAHSAGQAKLYRESDFPSICVALARHTMAVCQGVTEAA